MCGIERWNGIVALTVLNIFFTFLEAFDHCLEVNIGETVLLWNEGIDDQEKGRGREMQVVSSCVS